MPIEDLHGVPDIQALLDEMESRAPHIGTSKPRSVSYRITDGDEPVDDALDGADEELQSWVDWQVHSELPFVQNVDLSALPVYQVPLCAVDTGLVRLGETEDGLIIALRGSIVTIVGGSTELHLYRTGPMYLRHADSITMLHQMGQQLGKPDIFVELNAEGNPVTVKAGVADNIQAYSDRFRNWFERILQRIAVRMISDGIVLLDGALTTNTRDTPTAFFNDLNRATSEFGNALIAVSKQSRLQIQNRAMRFWLQDEPLSTCYRRLMDIMPEDMKNRVMGATYAMRFSPIGLTYRVDIKPVSGQREDEAIDMLFSSCLIRSGYPDILVQAHAYSYFTTPSVAELQAQCGATYALRPQEESDLGAIFGPFGGRFK